MKKYIFIILILLFSSIGYCEPTILNGVITWDCDDNTDYTLTSTILDADDSGFRLTDNTGAILDELDDSDFSNWADSSNLSQDTDTYRFGGSSAKAISAGSDYSQINQTYRLWIHLRHSVMVKFNASGGIGNRSVQFLTRAGGLVSGLGIIPSVSGTNFSYWDNVLNQWTDTGFVISTDWKRISLAQYNLGTGTLRMGRSTIDAGLVVQTVKQIRAATANTTRWFNIDRIQFKNGNLYSTLGTVETPKAQPDKVYKWVTSDYSGSTDAFYAPHTTNVSLKFQWSTNGGGTWNGTWIELTDGNLGQIDCDADGQDAIKLQATLSIWNGIATPLLEEITISYDDSSAILYNAELYNAVIN